MQVEILPSSINFNQRAMSKLKTLKNAKVAPTESRVEAVGSTQGLADIAFAKIAKSKEDAAQREVEKLQRLRLNQLLIPVTKQAGKKWVMVCQKKYGLPLMRGEDRVKLAGYAKRYSKGREDFIKYLEWCLESWLSIIAAKFKWMSDPPNRPSVPMFIRFSNVFEHLWLDREQVDAMASMTQRERLVHEAKRKGMRDEAAERDADDHLGITTEREKLNRLKSEMKKERNLLQREQEKSDRSDRVLSSRRRAAELIAKVNNETKAEAKIEKFKPWED